MAEMYFAKVLITPDYAESLLKTNPRNRNIKKSDMRTIVQAIENGEFELTHQCIAIDEKGMLVDGHHRLSAVVYTGKSVEMMVAYNAPNSTKIDGGTPRNSRDKMYMAGIIDKGSAEYCHLTYPLINLIISRNINSKPLKSSPDTLHRIYLELQEHIDTVLDCVSKRGAGKSRGAVVLYAMLCAEMSGVSVDTLREWHKILSTGDFYIDGDDIKTKAGRSILLLKNYLDNRKIYVGLSSDKIDEAIKKIESSIRYFDMKYPATKIYGEFVYPEVKLQQELLK